MNNSTTDIIVIGAGIHGAGVALAAADAGYSVLVLEKSSVAAGTSSRSSKLIHGGLRYLESGQISLVYECLQQRSELLKLYPDLVKAVPFYIPLYRSSHRQAWQIHLGLSLYGLLSGFKSHSRFHRIKKTEWSTLDQLRSTDLRAVYQYWDAQTDDSLLTQRVMQEAMGKGAKLTESAQVSKIMLEASGCQVTINQGEKQCTHQSTAVINAAGPWCNHILDLTKPDPEKLAMDLVQGTHIIIDKPTRKGVYYLESPLDQRAIFVMPWQGKTLVGTTEHLFTGDPDQVKPLATEIDYLSKCYAHYFQRGEEKIKILDSFAGLRVLPKQAGAAFHRPRETIVHAAPDARMLTIYGGKLTAFRSTAAKVLSKINHLCGT